MKKVICLYLILSASLIGFSQKIYCYAIEGNENCFYELYDKIVNIGDYFTDKEIKAILSTVTKNVTVKRELCPTSFIVDNIDSLKIRKLCYLLGHDSTKVCFTSLLSDKQGHILWTSNSVICSIKASTDISELLNKYNILYNTLYPIGSDGLTFIIKLAGPLDRSFETCNILAKDSNVVYAEPNFYFMVNSDSVNYNNRQ